MVSRLTVALLVFAAVPAFAQDAPSKGWIDFDFVSVQPAQDAQTYTGLAPLFGEIASFASAYPDLPSAKGGNIGAGFNFHPRVGLGFHFLAVKYDMPVGLAVSIPHPIFANRFATDADVTSSQLERTDRSLDILATFTAPTPDAIRVRVFGGPTYFRVRQNMVSLIRYTQVFNLLGANVVDITTFDDEDVEGSAWGFNVGADVAYFFSRHVGVGGVVRFNQGTVDIDSEPLTGDSAELKAGHTLVGGGLRLRF